MFVDGCTWKAQLRSLNFWRWFYNNYYLKFIKACLCLMDYTQLNSLKGWLIKKLLKNGNGGRPGRICALFSRWGRCSLSGSHWAQPQPPWRRMFGYWQRSRSVSSGCCFPVDVEGVVAKQPSRAKSSYWDDFLCSLFLLLWFGVFQFLNESQVSSANHLIPRAYTWYQEGCGARQCSAGYKSPEVNNHCSKVAKATCFCWQHWWQQRGWRKETCCLL